MAEAERKASLKNSRRIGRANKEGKRGSLWEDR